MKRVIWVLFGVLALLWTGAAWALTALLQWAAGLATPGDAVELGRVVTAWPIPAWVTWWIDPAAIHAALGGLVWLLETLQQGWPWLREGLAWLVPVAWVAWGCGVAVLLTVALFGHWLAGRFGAGTAPARTA